MSYQWLCVPSNPWCELHMSMYAPTMTLCILIIIMGTFVHSYNDFVFLHNDCVPSKWFLCLFKDMLHSLWFCLSFTMCCEPSQYFVWYSQWFIVPFRTSMVFLNNLHTLCELTKLLFILYNDFLCHHKDSCDSHNCSICSHNDIMCSQNDWCAVMMNLDLVWCCMNSQWLCVTLTWFWVIRMILWPLK